jgi:hypothetical protein
VEDPTNDHDRSSPLRRGRRRGRDRDRRRRILAEAHGTRRGHEAVGISDRDAERGAK